MLIKSTGNFIDLRRIRQIKITKGNSFILTCWTNMPQKQNPKLRNQPYFVVKNLHLHIKDNHLFICDNSWNSLNIKKIDYSKMAEKMEDWDEMNKNTLKQKGDELDGIAIDLTANKECESLKLVRGEKVKND